MNFNENIRNDEKKSQKNQGVMLTKLIISRLFIAIEYLT